MYKIGEAAMLAKAKGGVVSWIKRGYLGAAAALTFVRLLLLPVIPNELPANIRVTPRW
jgi:magnesium-protoporphyrin IX monomethyl ester (oxidative) cyclase